MTEDKEIMQAAIYKHYILSKIMEVYSYVLLDKLPTNHITNKSKELLQACKKFYQAFDKKIKIEGVEAIDDMTLEYFTVFDSMVSLTPESFLAAKDFIKDLVQRQNLIIDQVERVKEINYEKS